MNNNFIRLRYLLIGVVIMIGYFLYNQTSLMRVFHRYYNFYLVGYIVTLLLFAYSGQIVKLQNRLGWVFASPLVGSVVGYIFVSMYFFYEHGYVVKQSFLDWLFICTVNAYFMAKLWVLSFAFLLYCAIDFIFEVKMRGASRYVR